MQLVACGGGNTTTGSGGAPTISNKCTIEQLVVSSGDQATLSKNSSSLSLTASLSLIETSSINISSNFENSTADDWIEALPFQANLAAGNHTINLRYDLNSPSKAVTDRYTKLNVTVILPRNEACIANKTVNITLTP